MPRIKPPKGTTFGESNPLVEKKIEIDPSITEYRTAKEKLEERYKVLKKELKFIEDELGISQETPETNKSPKSKKGKRGKRGTPVKTQILELLKAAGGKLTKKEIIAKLPGVSVGTISATLGAMKKEKLITNPDQGVYEIA